MTRQLYNRSGALADIIAIMPTFVVPAIIWFVLISLISDTFDYKTYFFAYSLTVLMILQIYRHDLTFKIGTIAALPIRTVDYAIIICSAVTFVSNYLNNPLPLVSAVFSTFTILFVPGWVLLRILENKENRFHKKGVVLVLTFTLSTALSGIIFTLSAFYPTMVSPLLLAAIYLAISIVPLLKHTTFSGNDNYQKNTSHLRSEYKLFDVLLLIWILIFFIFVIVVLYPEMSMVPGLDIVTQFSQSKAFLLASHASDSVYPWYHFLMASILQLSSSPMLIFQSVIACFSYMLIVSFYIMARTYLSDIDHRGPIWATVLFSVFAGFGWLYYLEKVKNSGDMESNIQTLNQVAAGTYFDVGYGESGWIWFWFRPLTLGLIILFVLLSLLRYEKLSKSRYTLIFSLLLVALTQIHLAEFVLFVMFLFMVTVLLPRIGLRLKETTLSVLIALVAYVVLSFSYSHVLNFNNFSTQMVIGLGVLGGISFILARYTKRSFSRLKINFKYPRSLLVILSVLFIYLALLFHWFLDAENFDSYTSYTKLLTLYAVPWQFYPMLLGVTGIVAIIAAPILIKRYKDHPLVTFIVMLILMVCIGRVITYIGSEVTLTGYFERRIVFLVFTAAALLAPIGIFAILGYLSRLKLAFETQKRPNLATVSFISFLVAIGTLSTLISIGYQIDYVKEYAISNGMIEAVQESVDRDPYSTLLTVSPESLNIAKFSSPGYIIGSWSNQIWPSKSPELPLNIMSIFNSSFIYMQGNDKNIINNRYGKGYVDEHILEIAPVVRQNESLKVTQLPKLSPPTKHTDNLVLVLPDIGNMSQSQYYAYDMLSLAGYNYSTVLESDIQTIRNAKVVVAPSEYIASKMIQYKKEYGLQYQKLIVLNLDGYGKIWAELTKLSATRDLSTSSSIKLDSASRNNDNTLYAAKNLKLHQEIVMIPYVPRADAEQIALFENTNVPFILEKKGSSNGFDIIYINLDPVIEVTSSEEDKSGKIYSVLQTVLDFLPVMDLPGYDSTIGPTPSSLTSGGVAAFEKAKFEGGLSVNSSSGIIENIDGSAVELIVDGRRSVLEDVSRLVPVSMKNLMVRADRGGVLENGYGFYSSVVTNESKITAVGDPAILLVEANNHNEADKTTTVVSGKEIQFSLNKSITTLRQPNVLSNGIAHYIDFYAYGELYNELPVLGRTIKIDGENSFDIDYSDDFTVVSSASFEGEFLGEQPAYTYDELGSLSRILSLPYARHLALLVAILALIAIYIDTRLRFPKKVSP